jgi:hypothetical protein
MRKIVTYPGQRVIATDGKTYTVAYSIAGKVFAFGSNGVPTEIRVCGDAWGGEHDQALGLAA